MAGYGAHVNNHVAQKITGGWGKEHVHGCAPRHTKVCQCPQLHTIAYSNVDVGVPWCTLVSLVHFGAHVHKGPLPSPLSPILEGQGESPGTRKSSRIYRLRQHRGF